jgi:tellurite resistance protein TehA-like permease|tara:strand:+ start:28 stop:204 length:177 start_codon:yes stop_codon:yes gene_type:complete
MNKIFYAISDFFGLIFSGVEEIGNTINYLYIVIIFAFLVIWTIKMLKHRKDGEEHASS